MSKQEANSSQGSNSTTYYVVVDEFKADSNDDRDIRETQFFEIPMRQYEAEFRHRRHPMTDCTIRVLLDCPRNHLDYGAIKPPCWFTDSLLDRCGARKQHSPMNWSEACDFMGIYVVDETNFRYSYYRPTTPAAPQM